MITTIIKKQAIKIGKELLKKEWGNTYCDDCILKKGGELLYFPTCKVFNQAIIGEEEEAKILSCNTARTLVINKLKMLNANTRTVKI